MNFLSQIPEFLNEIIPNSHGGPLEWWNIHPVKAGADHQGGIHGAGSTLNKSPSQRGENALCLQQSKILPFLGIDIYMG